MSDRTHYACPKCQSIYQKNQNLMMGKVVSFESGNCEVCGYSLSIQDIYDGAYDVEVVNFNPPTCIPLGYKLK